MAWNVWYKDKICVVTGGANGIGKRLGELLIDFGAIVYLLDIEFKNRESTENLHKIPLDVTDFDMLKHVAKEIFNRHGRIDLIINNAGVVDGASFIELTPESFKRSMDINFWGVINGIYAFLPYVRQQRHPVRIVNIASAAGLMGLPYVAPYCASKAAIVGLTESLISENKKDIADFILVTPGAVKTDVIKNGHLKLPGNSKHRIIKLNEQWAVKPNKVAMKILKATVRGKAFIFPAGGVLKFLWWIKRLSLTMYYFTAKKIGSFGPKIEKRLKS